MKGPLFFTMLLTCFLTFSQSQQLDSINTLDEVTLIEEFITKKAVGITESSSFGGGGFGAVQSY